jgi:hypothetical protein
MTRNTKRANREQEERFGVSRFHRVVPGVNGLGAERRELADLTRIGPVARSKEHRDQL